MHTQETRAAAGCLVIDELRSGGEPASGFRFLRALAGVEVQVFRQRPGGGLWDDLQTALQALRAKCETASILSRGTGCAAALALAAQLPVERLALVDPDLSPGRFGAFARQSGRGACDPLLFTQICRLSDFARRNLALCVSDVLMIERGEDREARALRRGLSAHGRVFTLRLDGDFGDEMYTVRENTVKQALSCFLCRGELPKTLAENAEMCIIYG